MLRNKRITMKKQKQIQWIGHYTFIVLSGIWGLVALYGFFTFGWIGQLSNLSPAELVVQVSALFFPICFFYLIGNYIDRNQLAALNLEASKTYLEELVYPSELGAQHVQDLNNELKLQKTINEIHKKYGKNSVLKGMNLEEGGTTKDRNNQIGGHRK